MLCNHEKCEHYFNATKYPRKCYYEPQCWKGFVDIMLVMLLYRFHLRS